MSRKQKFTFKVKSVEYKPPEPLPSSSGTGTLAERLIEQMQTLQIMQTRCIESGIAQLGSRLLKMEAQVHNLSQHLWKMDEELKTMRTIWSAACINVVHNSPASQGPSVSPAEKDEEEKEDTKDETESNEREFPGWNTDDDDEWEDYLSGDNDKLFDIIDNVEQKVQHSSGGK